MLIGYARTSTVDQDYGLDAQIEALQAAGCDPEFIHREKVSSVANRPKLDEVLKHLRKGDTLLVTKLDRLARSMRDLLRIVDLIQEKKAALRILGTDIDTGTPTGKLMLNLLGSFAEFERQIMLERQRAGIARAKTEGKFKRRKPTARAKSDAIMQLHGQGVAAAEIAHRLEISRASVYRVLEDERAKAEGKPEGQVKARSASVSESLRPHNRAAH
jgi:DNA invertase Pin-like site-specific DNA recombinase